LLIWRGLYRNYKEHSNDQYLLSIATVSWMVGIFTSALTPHEQYLLSVFQSVTVKLGNNWATAFHLH
jgi:hypothetical protein